MIELLPTMPTPWALVTSCLASDAICDGLVCSVSGKYLIGWPLIPPLALTHAKYAAVMFSMSLKSVPGCLVSIAPRLMGVPVAATPGLVPQEVVEVVLPLAEEAAALLAAGALDDAARQRGDGGRRRPRAPVDVSIHVLCLLVANSESLIFRTGACSASRRSTTPGGSRKDAVHRVHE